MVEKKRKDHEKHRQRQHQQHQQQQRQQKTHASHEHCATQDPTEIQVLQRGYGQWRKGKHKGAKATAVLRGI